MPEVRLPSGEPVYVRGFQRELVSALFAAWVVRHDDDGLLLWTPQGSRHWFPYLPDGRELRATPLPEWHAADKVWTPYHSPRDVLTWYVPGVPYSVQLFFEGGRFTNYYANIEDPAVVWRDADSDGGDAFGVDTEDWDLDVWVEPDLSWRLKDEDDVVSRLQWPELYWVDDADRVFEIGRQVVALVEERAFPFDGTWRDFTPDPAWSPITDASMPAGWDRPRRRR